ncbi:MAG: hypothetical protein RLZZ519_848 [Bacteroidota bacterium]|jgi:predicted aspartyl protease
MPHWNHQSSDLEIYGPTIEVKVMPARAIVEGNSAQRLPVPSFIGLALIDTGASSSAIDYSVAKKLGLISYDFQEVLTPAGSTIQSVYDATIVIPLRDDLGFDVQVFGADLERQAFDVLIGRDILRYCTLIYSGWDNRYTLHL